MTDASGPFGVPGVLAGSTIDYCAARAPPFGGSRVSRNATRSVNSCSVIVFSSASGIIEMFCDAELFSWTWG